MENPPHLTLAQLGNFLNPDVAPLPEPSFLQRFVLEQPMLPTAAVLVAGVIALIALRQNGAVRPAVISLISAAGLAAALLITGTAVETPRERLLARQDRLVDAVANADIPTLDAMLAPDARVRGVALPMLREGLDRPRILSTVRAMLGERYDVTTVGTIERQAVVDGRNAARTQIYLRVATESSGQTWTWFLIGWRLGDDGTWRAIEIEPLFISGVLPYNS